MIGKPPMPSTPAPLSDADFGAAHRALLADRSIQFDLPMYQPPAARPAPRWWGGLFDWLSAEHPLLRILVYALLIAAAALILWLLVRAIGRSEFWRRLMNREEAPPSPEESWRPAEAPARALLSEADALAAQGLYSQAAHLLLFRSIEDIDHRRPDLVRPALTSRDIAGLPALPERPRSAFTRIAMLVERSLFARRDLVEGDWRECRAAYETFAFADAWQ
jgi:hypothetical protein